MGLGQGLGLHESITKLVDTLTPKGVEPEEGVFFAFPLGQLSWLDDDLKRAFGGYSVLVPSTSMTGYPRLRSERHDGSYVRDLALHTSGALVPPLLREALPTKPYRPPVGVLIQYCAHEESSKE